MDHYYTDEAHSMGYDCTEGGFAVDNQVRA